MVSVIMLPVNLVIYASGSYSSAVVKSLDWYALFMSLFVVIGGISSGLFCSAYFKDSPAQAHQMHKTANVFGNLSGMCLITYSIFVTSSDHKAALWDQSWDFFVGLAIPAVVGITTATLLATRFKLDRPERVAVAVESCYQNTGIATSVAAVMFDSDEDDVATAMSVPLYYGIVEMALLGAFCVICWKAGWTKAPADEKFCVVLGKSYEVAEADDSENSAIGVVMAGVTKVEGDCEEGKLPKPPLIFEQSEATLADEESVGSGAVVLRKADTAETVSIDGAEPLSPRECDDQGRHEDSASLPGSFSGDDGDNEDVGSKDAAGVGRLGKTISFVKARATGYRRAPLPGSDEVEGRIDGSSAVGTGIPESAEVPGGCRQINSMPPSPEPSAKSEQAQKEAPTSPLSQDETDATPADGKTLD